MQMSSVHDPLLLRDSGMSKDRRRFLIVIVFDFCLVTLLWLICTVTKGDDWSTVFLREVNIFDPFFMKISLFDIVMLAILRMLLLVLFYAILFVGHWLPVAVTTIVTTLFLVVKVLFFFSREQGSLPQYLVILNSFTGAWFELWLVPFRVLPRERRQMIVPERSSPTIFNVRRLQQTDDEFRSAMEYSSESDSEESKVPTSSIQDKMLTKSEYLEAADQGESKAREIANTVDSWKVVNSFDPQIRFCEGSRTYYIKALIKCSPETLFDAVWKNSCEWNKQISETRTILHLDNYTDLVYSVSAPVLGGCITSRDFLDVRRTRIVQDQELYEGFFVSVNSCILPPNLSGKLIRGHNGPNLVRCTRSLDNSELSVYEWIMNTDLKGQLPRRLIERTVSSFFFSHVRDLRSFVSANTAGHP